jgi:ankyrin repeat protein
MQELPDGMNEVYRKSLQSLQQDDRKMLITALRWLVCGEGRIDANWVADELQNLYGDDNIPPDSDQEETPDDDVDASDLAEFEQGDDTEAGANEQREIVKDLQRIGRDFLKFNGDIVEFDHKSVRDFVIDDEKLIRHQTFRCPECADRIASYSVYEAGTKHGHLLMTQRILSHLNSPTFQKKFILPQESTAVAEVTTEVVAVDGQDSNGLDTHSAASLTEEEPSIATDLAAELNNFSGERTTNLAESGADDDTKSVASSVSTDAGPILAPTYNFEEVDGPYESQDLRYELSHWHMHLRAAEEAWPQEDREDDTWEAIYQAVEKFLDPGTPVYGSWLKRIFHWREFKTIDDPFLIASRFGLVNVVKRYLKRNSSKEYVNMVNENNGTALHLACAGKGDLETISVLVAAGVNVHLKDRWECTALLILCSLDSIPLDAVKYLLDHGAEPQVCDDEKLTCLHFAAARGNLEVCKLLLARDEVDVDAEDDSGESPLHHAFRFPNVSGELIQLLLDRKPNVNAQDKDSQAPLYEACSVGNVAGAALLLDYRDGDIRVDINDDEKIFGHTALHASVKASSLELVKLLVSRGADMSLKDKQGHDPIFQAAEEGEDEILAFLLGSWKDRGFDMQFLAQVDINGHTPLHRAAAKGHTACVEVLLQQGDGKHLSMQLNHNGATPLHSAARRGHFASTKLMLDNGADPMARTNKNETPLALAFDGVRRRTSNDELSRFISAITLLVECVPITETGVDVLEWAIEQRLEDLCRLLAPQSNSPNEDGWKPLTLARHLGHTDLASLLIDTGSETMLTPTRLMRSDLVTFPVLSDDGLKISCKNSESLLQADQQECPLTFHLEDFFFTGDWTTYYSHGLVLADHPVPASCHHYYFEITLLVYNNDEP